MSGNRKHLVGRTTVYIDSHGDQYRFVRDGHDVICVCDETTGMVCRYHAARFVPTVLTQLDRVLAAVEQREVRGHWEPSPTRFGVVRWHPVPGPDKPQGDS